MDLAGRTVSPGVIDLISSAGLPSTTPVPVQGSAGSSAPAPRQPGVDPDRLAAESVRLAPSDAKTFRTAGITAVLVSPARGLFRGQSALVPTRDSAGPADVIRSPVAQHVGYQGLGSGEYPGSLLGVIALQRQMFYDAQRYGVVEDRWRANPRGVSRPERDPRLEALVPAARGAEPVWIDARNENEIRRAGRLARELNLRLTVVGATEGWRAIDALRGTGVVVSLDFPRPTDVTGWRFRTGMLHATDDSAAAELAAKKLIERNAASLNTAGIRFALSSGGRPSDLLANTRKVVAAGLPAAVALEALTIRAAELAGVGEALGSIESREDRQPGGVDRATPRGLEQGDGGIRRWGALRDAEERRTTEDGSDGQANDCSDGRSGRCHGRHAGQSRPIRRRARWSPRSPCSSRAPRSPAP